MKTEGDFQKYGNTISYVITDEQKDKIISRLLEYYTEHGYIGEVIQQDDDALLMAPYVLSDICDNFIEFTEEIEEGENE